MISDRVLAQDISSCMLEFGARLNELVARAKPACSDSEFQQFKKAIGNVMGDMLLELMNPIYARHPDLKPRELA